VGASACDQLFEGVMHQCSLLVNAGEAARFIE
jgi:hypothetical protein